MGLLDRQRVANSVEGILDLAAEDAHNRNYDDRDERKNNCVFDQPLAFFLKGEQHGINSFLQDFYLKN